MAGPRRVGWRKRLWLTRVYNPPAGATGPHLHLLLGLVQIKGQLCDALCCPTEFAFSPSNCGGWFALPWGTHFTRTTQVICTAEIKIYTWNKHQTWNYSSATLLALPCINAVTDSSVESVAEPKCSLVHSGPSCQSLVNIWESPSGRAQHFVSCNCAECSPSDTSCEPLKRPSPTKADLGSAFHPSTSRGS